MQLFFYKLIILLNRLIVSTTKLSFILANLILIKNWYLPKQHSKGQFFIIEILISNQILLYLIIINFQQLLIQ